MSSGKVSVLLERDYGYGDEGGHGRLVPVRAWGGYPLPRREAKRGVLPAAEWVLEYVRDGIFGPDVESVLEVPPEFRAARWLIVVMEIDGARDYWGEYDEWIEDVHEIRSADPRARKPFKKIPEASDIPLRRCGRKVPRFLIHVNGRVQKYMARGHGRKGAKRQIRRGERPFGLTPDEMAERMFR